MSVSFIRIDDRMIHGQTCTRWAREYPCDGLVAVNDKAANNSVLKAAYKSASGKKTFVWTMEAWQKKCQKLIAGSTGSGKSVCINAIVMSFLYKSSPEDLKLIMIDPKVVELA